ncbi:hypothetical protein V8C43DRAFT_278830 [Trichoderma afarasin]
MMPPSAPKTPKQSHPPARLYKRGYKACEACRKRKTRCDLGGGDQSLYAFSGPPCAQCRRANRECVFREERNTSLHRVKDSHLTSPATPGTYAAACDLPREPANLQLDIPISNGDENSRSNSDLYRVDDANVEQTQSREPTEQSHHTNSTRSPVSQMSRYSQLISPSSGLMQEASTVKGTRCSNIENGLVHPPHDSTSHQSRTLPSTANLRQADHRLTNIVINTLICKGNDPLNLLFEAAAEGAHISIESPRYLSSAGFGRIFNDNIDYSSPWTSYKFVRMGLLSAEQAVYYVDAFFENLSPKSPILTNYFADHANHSQLVSQEPFLCLIILMISSRYHTLSGTASISKGHYIHDRLWHHTQQLLQQISLGQGRASNRRLRSIGTIEALLLLTEWYPQAMQFMDSHDEWDGEPSIADDSLHTQSPNWLEGFIEPCRQFDRMSWMILGSAHMLAHELGIFRSQQEERVGIETDAVGEARRTKVCDLLFIYMTLLAARLGFHSILPLPFSQSVLSRATGSSTQTIEAWIELLRFTKTVHASMMSSASNMRELLLAGNHIELIEHFKPILSQWRHKYLGQILDEPNAETAESSLRDLLFIEYHYVRMYTISPAIHAVAMQISSRECGSLSDSPTNARMQTMVIEEQLEYPFVEDVIHDAYQILRRGIQLTQNNMLKFHPARTFHRFITACVFLLKAKILGLQQIISREGNTSIDLSQILEQSVQALKISAIDDAHLAAYYAAILEHHLANLNLEMEVPAVSFTTANAAHSKTYHQSRTNSSEDWHTGWIDPFDQTDLFTTFSVFNN